MTARTPATTGDLPRTRPEGTILMNQLLVPATTGADDIPALSADAVIQRAAQDYAPPPAAPAPPPTAAPDPGQDGTDPSPEDSGRRPKMRLPRRPHRGNSQARSGLAVRIGSIAGMTAALSVLLIAAGWLTFPHTPPFSRIHGQYAAALVSGGAIAAIICAIVSWRAARRAMEGRKGSDMLTILAATVAMTVSATGMWAFFAMYVPSIPVLIRIPIFAFLEISALSEALRARDNMRERAARAAEGQHVPGGLDIDAVAMWAFVGISAFLAALASTTIAEGIFRLAPPLVAAWLWERALVGEKRRIDRRKKRSGIAWRISPERILVKLGLADPSGKSLDELAAAQRITAVALAVEQLGNAEAAGLGPDTRQWKRANEKLRTALRKATEQTDLASSPDRQAALQSQIAILTNPHQLLALSFESPWEAAGTRRADRPEPRVKDENPQPKPKPREKSAPPAVPFEKLAADLGQAMRQQDAETIHSLLAGRTDHAVIARQLGKRAAFGDKRLLTLVALYAVPEGMERPVKTIEWAARTVLGQAGQLDKTELRTIRTLMKPVWDEHRYNVPA